MSAPPLDSPQHQTPAAPDLRAALDQRDMLLEALHTLGVRLGVLDPSVACDGPQLLTAMGAYSDSLAASPPQAETLGLDREALGDPFLAGHSGCEEGPHVKLIYETVAEAMLAHDALRLFLRTHPPSDPAAPTEPCDCKIGDCKRITRRCLEGRS